LSTSTKKNKGWVKEGSWYGTRIVYYLLASVRKGVAPEGLRGGRRTCEDIRWDNNKHQGTKVVDQGGETPSQVICQRASNNNNCEQQQQLHWNNYCV